MRHLPEIGFTPRGTLLIPLDKGRFGLTGDSIVFEGRVFEPKDEVHVTVVGKGLGWAIERAVEGNPNGRERVRILVEEAPWKKEGWIFQPSGGIFHVAKDKKRMDGEGNPFILRAESIIVLLETPGVEDFLGALSGIIEREIEGPPIHATLFTRNDPVGIGLPDRVAFERFVKGEILPEQWRGWMSPPS